MNMIATEPQTFGLQFDNQPVLETKRLLLRKVVAADIGNVQSVLNRYDVARMLIAVPQPFDLLDAKQIVDRWSQPTVAGWGFAICRKEDPEKELIGLLWIVWRNESWRLGMWLSPENWGRGLMTEALNAVLQPFFRKCIGETLNAGVISDNPASLKVQQKLGFEIIGTSQTFCISRNEMVDIIDTELSFSGFQPL